MFNLQAVPCDDQPIQASLLGESRYLSSWVTPGNLEIQEAFARLTEGLEIEEDKVFALWKYVRDIEYTPYVSSHISVGGVSFKQDDVWLDPAQTLRVKKLNCFNKSILLASLLRQIYEPSEVFVSLNNVTCDSIGGHAVVYLANGDYIMETTSPHLRNPWLKASDTDIYEAVLFFNDQEVKAVPNVELSQPLGNCHCIRWLEDYIDERLCVDWKGN